MTSLELPLSGLPALPVEFGYRRGAVFRDGLTSIVGGLFCAGIATQVPVEWFPFGFLVALALLFLAFGGLTLLRARMRIIVSAQGVTWQSGQRSLQWNDLSDFELAYYSTRRDREAGWMQLTLTVRGGQHLRIDSRLEAFDQLVRVGYRAASYFGATITPTTLHNLRALGFVRD